MLFHRFMIELSTDAFKYAFCGPSLPDQIVHENFKAKDEIELLVLVSCMQKS